MAKAQANAAAANTMQTMPAMDVRENRGYLENRHVDVPWTNKDLTVKWEHFTSKLEPGQKETWTAIITGPDAKRTVAEMAATLYDESLDAYLPHSWLKSFAFFRQVNGWETSHLGRMYRPKYFQPDGFAVHGDTFVPSYPASHGCVRVSLAAIDFIWGQNLAPLGSPVWVYGTSPPGKLG